MSTKEFNRYCRVHKDEQIKYICLDEDSPLCAECLVDHSRHKFIKADLKVVN
jgi:hypothetical protein